VAVIATVAIGAMLWTIPAVQELGAGILASAGVLGIVAGLAAQTSLGNLFAGIQISFTDAIRIGDVVEIDNLWGGSKRSPSPTSWCGSGTGPA
jgi:small-conductance mechanosensitive channel